jgi:hypothetical protein
MSMSDDFASRFDSIAVEKAPAFAGAPAAEVIEGPGFSLLDDAGGRFGIERDTGIISVVHDETLATDIGATFSVTLRCVEFSGLSYEQQLRLKVTGRVPQIVGNDADEALSRLAQGPLDAEPVAPVRRVRMSFGEPAAQAAPVVRSNWSQFAAFHAHAARQPLNEDGAFGALLGATLPSVTVDAALALDTPPPAPAPAHLTWTI